MRAASPAPGASGSHRRANSPGRARRPGLRAGRRAPARCAWRRRRWAAPAPAAAWSLLRGLSPAVPHARPPAWRLRAGPSSDCGTAAVTRSCAGSYSVTKGAPRHGHVAQGHGHLGHHAGIGRAHHVQAGLRARGARLGRLRAGLGAGGTHLGLGSVQRGLADVLAWQRAASGARIRAWPRRATHARPAPGHRRRRRFGRHCAHRCAAATGPPAPCRPP